MTTKLEQAAQLALDALEDIGDEFGFTSKRTVPKRAAAIKNLREALSEKQSITKLTTERNTYFDEIDCPVCGYYCLGKGGSGCIDKPTLCGLNKSIDQC